MASKNEVAQALAESERPRIDPVAAALTAYEPSWRERIGNSVYDAANYVGLGGIANRLRGDVETGIDFVPLIGDAVGFDDARNDFNAGNYGMAAAGLGLSAAGIVPGVGDAVAAGGRKILSAGAENARVVADMLASGRANEVTNDMISAADPAELWKLYESGATGVPMPMDQASRMARAREMGFDTDMLLYRGDDSGLDSFRTGHLARENIGVTTSTSPNVAATYLTKDDSAMYPVMSSARNRLEIDADGRNWSAVPADAQTNRGALNDVIDPEQYLDEDNLFDFLNGDVVDWGDGSTTALAIGDTNSISRAAQSQGFDETRFNNIVDRGGAGKWHTGPANDPHTTVMTADPSNIRSQFARFDPRLKHLSHLSAGLAGAVAAGTISLEVANQMQELGQDYQP